jgi:hypothetical protein
VHQSTAYRWIERGRAADATGRYAVFVTAVQEAEAGARVEAVSAVFAAIRQGSWKAALAYLERRDPQQSGRINRHEVSGPQGAPLPLAPDGTASAEALARLSDEDLDTFLDLQTKMGAGNGRGDR